MKKVLVLVLAFAMVFCMFACGEKEDPQPEVTTYEIACVTDVGQLMDGSFNQYTWAGCEAYAKANGLNAKYYQPANGAQATDDDRIKAMRDACAAGAQAIVTPGFLQATAIDTVAKEYPNVQFVFIDGWDMGMANVVGVAYQEEQAGYLAGYAVVKEGFEKLGFSGGGGGTNPACIRYGYGFAQGANAAAAEMGKTVEMRYSWEYGASFSASDDLQAMINGWFNAGTEICFMCGGTMFNSGVAAAEANSAKIVGVDVDQSAQAAAGTVVTSAMKGLTASVQTALGNFYKSGLQTGELRLGAKDDAVGLPVDTWSLKNWSVADYNALFTKIVSGEVVVDNNSEMADPSTAGLANVKFVK